MPDEAVRKQIEGVCVEISEKNGWTAFHIDVGSQYPVKLNTKLPDLVAKGRSVGDARAVWSYDESQGGPNPHKPGTFYTNRYFADVTTDREAIDSVAANNATHPEPSRNAPPTNWAEKDKQIVRQSCLKVAATLVAATGTSDGDVGSETISLAARFETWVRRDVDDPPFD